MEIPGARKVPSAFSTKEDPRETDQEVTADLFDDISKEKQRRKFAHCCDRGCSTHFCTSSAFTLCDLEIEVIQEHMTEVDKNTANQYQ